MEKAAAKTERMIVAGRLVLAVTAFAALLVDPPEPQPTAIYTYVALAGYLTYSSFLFVFSRRGHAQPYPPRLTYAGDIACLLAVLLFTEGSVAPFFLFYLFVIFVTSLRWGLRRAMMATAALAAIFVLLGFLPFTPIAIRYRSFYGQWGPLQFLVAAVCLLGLGYLVGRMGDIERQEATRLKILEGLAGTVNVEQGFRESLRCLMAETQKIFRARRAFLVFEDLRTRTLFLWKLEADGEGELTLEERRLEERPLFFQDGREASFCWQVTAGNHLSHWEGREGLTEERLLEPPRLVASFAELFQARSILTVPFRFRGEPVGRVILLDREGGPFTEEDLDLLQLLIRQLTPVVENVFTLRRLRLRAIEGERDRIARDLHDGVLQTLASLDMQLDVLRRLTLKDPERLAAELAQLQQIVKTEGIELREFVGDLKPLQIESADLVELLESYIDRFRNETGLVVELLADRMNIDLPEKVCREIFQMIREGLNNVKKHAQATHVVIKMKQDERYLHLVIDDNGKGFSFAGTYASEALDSLRLGPISIKEHAHALSGQLTIESTPGHGARLRIDIPV